MCFFVLGILHSVLVVVVTVSVISLVICKSLLLERWVSCVCTILILRHWVGVGTGGGLNWMHSRQGGQAHGPGAGRWYLFLMHSETSMYVQLGR